MKTDFEKIIEDLKGIKLSKIDKAILRDSILEEIETPSYVQNMPKTEISFGGVFVLFRNHALAFSLALLLIFAGTGVTVAAEDALPGDALYTFKIKVNEGVRDALAMHPAQKAQWETQKAKRRLQEFEGLASEGKLDENTEEDLQRRVVMHTSEAQEAINSLEERDSLVALIDAASSLESVLKAQRNILAHDTDVESGPRDEISARTQKEFSMLKQDVASTSDSLSSESTSTEDLGEGVQDQGLQLPLEIGGSEEKDIVGKEDILVSVEESLESISNKRINAENRIENMSDKKLKNSSIRAQRRAEVGLRSLNKSYEKIAGNINETDESYIESEISKIELALGVAEEFMKKGDYSKSFVAYTRTYALISSLDIYLESLVTVNNVIEIRKEEGGSVEASATTSENQDSQENATSSSDLSSTNNQSSYEKQVPGYIVSSTYDEDSSEKQMSSGNHNR